MEYACGLAPDLRGDYIEHVSSGMDTYSFRQPLGVPPAPPKKVEHQIHKHGDECSRTCSGVAVDTDRIGSELCCQHHAGGLLPATVARHMQHTMSRLQ